jgi:hypothetical protein
MEYIGISLQEYLIKHSGVDRKFIIDFISIQESNAIKEHYPFIINLDLVIKWLQITKKDHIKETLITSYTKNLDYILLLPREKQDSTHGGHNKETILLTVNCFKKICLRTKSCMSDHIIDYYIALENLLIEYQKYVISILISENKLLKNDLNNDIFPHGGVIYVMDLNNGYFKIGKTNNLAQRKIIYDTGTIHKNKIVFGLKLMTQHRLKNVLKDYYLDSRIKKIKKCMWYH